MKIINGTVENLNILLKKIYSLPVVYSLKKKENWKNDVSFYKKIQLYNYYVLYTIGKHYFKKQLYPRICF